MADSYRVYVGTVESPLFTFDNDSIESLIVENAVDIVGNELSSDVLEVGVFYDDTSGTLRSTQYATPIYFYSNGNFAGKYYITKIERTDTSKYLIHASSLIGLIGKEQFYGGFYTNKRFEEVLHEILFATEPVYDQYHIYKAESKPTAGTTSISSAWGVVCDNGSNSSENRTQRLQTAFTIGDALWYTNDTSLQRDIQIAGYYDSSSYSVWVSQHRASVGASTYFTVYVKYNGTTYTAGGDTPIIGTGSYVAIDVYPMGGTLSLVVDYVNYSNPSDTGQIAINQTISVMASNKKAWLGVAFSRGGTSASMSMTANIKWDYYRVYNEDGSPHIDEILVKNSAGKIRAINKINGMCVNGGSRLTTYGSSLGIVGDPYKYLQTQELLDSIEYAGTVADNLINGWLPISTRRDALHHLLFSENVSIIKTADGHILFTAIMATTPIEISDNDIYNETSEEPIEETRQVTVTEYSYTIPTSSAVVIYDNSDVAAVSGEYVAIFENAPIYGTPTGDGITIKSFNCNAAVVEGRGKITGTPYVSARNDIVYQDTNVYDGADVSVSNVPLITAVNSDNVMNKLKAYYCAAVKKIRLALIYGEQRCGIRYSFNSTFDDGNAGFLSKVSAKASSFVKADCEFVSGYVPPAGGGYGSYQIVEYNGEWAVPQEVREREYSNIRLILIGKGHDGTSGTNGASGASAQTGSGQKQGGAGGSGGAAGSGGAGGNVYQITVDVTNVAKIAVTNSSLNTIVKTYNDNDSLISTYNSSSGNPIDSGVTNLFTGQIYARKGKNGRAGGNGGAGMYDSYNGLVFSQPGQDVSVPYRNNPFKGGKSADQTFGNYKVELKQSDYYLWSFSSGGGGASDGHDGGDPKYTGKSGRKYFVKGGKGANAVQQFDVYTEYGSGGWGGNGGGGGGGAGTFEYDYFNNNYYTESQTPGDGGTGSAGTPGIDGCLLIYY